MIDLHLHLDGSLDIEDFKYLASRNGVSLGDDFPNNIYVPEDCTSLEEYLERFDLPLSLLQDEFSIAYAVESLVNRLYKKGFIYAEIRFAPQLHIRRGLSQDDVVLAATSGLRHALRDKEGFKANLILCCMRQSDYETNLPAIILAEKYRNSGGVAVDLAGPEAFKTADKYQDLFKEANNRNLNITIHAGEACGSSEVEMAVELLGAKRIGHGVHLDLSRENVLRMTQKRITFEFCPTSNLQTTSLASYEDVPLKKFYTLGIPVTINSDNMTVSHTDVFKEFKHIYKVFKLEKFEVRQLLTNSINAAFINQKEKFDLMAELDKRIDWFYGEILRP